MAAWTCVTPLNCVTAWVDAATGNLRVAGTFDIFPHHRDIDATVAHGANTFSDVAGARLSNGNDVFVYSSAAGTRGIREL